MSARGFGGLASPVGSSMLTEPSLAAAAWLPVARLPPVNCDRAMAARAAGLAPHEPSPGGSVAADAAFTGIRAISRDPNRTSARAVVRVMATVLPFYRRRVVIASGAGRVPR